MPAPVATTKFTFNDRLLYVPSFVSDLPALLASIGWTKREIHDHQDKVAYVLNRILTVPVFDSRYKHGEFIPLDYESLKQVLGTRYVKKILDALLCAGVIECDHKYFYGKSKGKALGYRITEKAQSKAVGLLIFKQETFGKKLFQWSQDQHVELRKNRFLNRIQRDMAHLRIHYADALDYNATVATRTQEFIVAHHPALQVTAMPKKAYAVLLDEAYALSHMIHLPGRKDLMKVLKKRQRKLPNTTVYDVLMRSALDTHSCNHMSIEKLYHQDWKLPTRPVKGSRVYTSLTNFSSYLRQFIYHSQYPGETLVNIDIKNSQPFLLCLLLMHRYRGQAMPADVQEYITLTSSGKFYEHVAQAMGVRIESKRERRDFKSNFFGSIFFCRNQHTEASKCGKWFKLHFPNVYQLIYDTKAVRYQNLADAMQIQEAKVILDVVVKALHAKKIWCASIHDSIICRPGDQEEVAALILDSFQDYGVRPSLDLEPLRKSKLPASQSL